MSTPDFFRSRLNQMIDLRHLRAVPAARLPWASIEAAIAPKLAHQAKPVRRVIGKDLAGAFEGEFGGGISPAGSLRLPIQRFKQRCSAGLVEVERCQWSA